MVFERVAQYLGKVSDRRTRVRRRLEEVFGRDMIGAVAVTSSVMKVVENGLNGNYGLLVKWCVIAVLFTAMFLHWEHVAEKADAAVEKAADKAEKATSKEDGDD